MCPRGAVGALLAFAGLVVTLARAKDAAGSGPGPGHVTRPSHVTLERADDTARPKPGPGHVTGPSHVTAGRADDTAGGLVPSHVTLGRAVDTARPGPGPSHVTLGQADDTPPCPLARLCARCSCRVDGRFAGGFCPAPGQVLAAVSILGGHGLSDGCPTTLAQLGRHFLTSFRTRSLELRGFRIGTLQNDALSGLSLVETLNLTNNRITHIEPDAFADLISLRSLKLTLNGLRQVPLLALSKAPLLGSLHLQHNRLTRLQPEPGVATLTLASLHTLDVSHNRIAYISPDFMKLMPKLSNLQLHRTQVRCGCALAWFRNFRKCLCVFSHNRCYGDITHSLIDFPVRASCPVESAADRGPACDTARNCVIPPRQGTRRKQPTAQGPARAAVSGGSGHWGPVITDGTGDSPASTTTQLLVTSKHTAADDVTSSGLPECSGGERQNDLSPWCFALVAMAMAWRLVGVARHCS